MTFVRLDHPVVSQSCSWLMEIGARGNRLGVHSDGGWCMEREGEKVRLLSANDFVPLLPLLEAGRSRVLGSIREIRDQGVVVPDFPEGLLLLCAFSYVGSDYWTEKAIVWLESSGSVLSGIAVDLKSILNQKHFSQKVKHKLLKMVSGY